MVDLFTDIPDDLIESTLQTIRENLDKVGLFGTQISSSWY